MAGLFVGCYPSLQKNHANSVQSVKLAHNVSTVVDALTLDDVFCFAVRA